MRNYSIRYFFHVIFAISMLFSYEVKTIFSQDRIEENESSESILAREQFISVRRAGGPGIAMPITAYEDALSQKLLITEDKNIPGSLTRLTSWVSVNPTGMFYNVTGNNYISGRTNSLAFHPTDPNIIYLAAAQGGVWKTINGGVSWVPLTDN